MVWLPLLFFLADCDDVPIYRLTPDEVIVCWFLMWVLYALFARRWRAIVGDDQKRRK